MAVSDRDVRHIGALARLGLAEDRIPSLAAELNGILEHMEVLGKVDTSRVVAPEPEGMPLRDDDGAQISLARERAAFAPQMRDGFFLVPRLATHEGLDASADS
jgi:aspartyl-tRNA(Asn)/glutamyl-tRNA(Gln) amidotransferase subunit C